MASQGLCSNSCPSVPALQNALSFFCVFHTINISTTWMTYTVLPSSAATWDGAEPSWILRKAHCCCSEQGFLQWHSLSIHDSCFYSTGLNALPPNFSFAKQASLLLLNSTSLGFQNTDNKSRFLSKIIQEWSQTQSPFRSESWARPLLSLCLSASLSSKLTQE